MIGGARRATRSSSTPARRTCPSRCCAGRARRASPSTSPCSPSVTTTRSVRRWKAARSSSPVSCPARTPRCQTLPVASGVSGRCGAGWGWHPGTLAESRRDHPVVRARGGLTRLRPCRARPLRPGRRGRSRTTLSNGRTTTVAGDTASGQQIGARRGTGGARAARRAGRGAPLPVLRERRAGRQRRRVRPAAALAWRRWRSEYPELRTPDSPTQKVAGAYETEFTSVEHRERHALPGQRLQRRGAGGLGRARRAKDVGTRRPTTSCASSRSTASPST